MKKQILSLLFLLAAASYTHSQIKVLNSGHITFGGVSPVPNYYLTSYGSLFLTNNDSRSQFLQFDVANARIAGTGNQVVFFNSQNSTYNDIQVRNVYNQSDARAKTNVRPINYGLSTIHKLRPVSYNLIKNPSGKNDHQELGLIAQELEQVLPGLVHTDNEGNKLVNYTGLIPVLIKSIQELQAEVAALKAAR